MGFTSIIQPGHKGAGHLAGNSDAFWNILVPTEDEAVALTRKTLENKKNFFRNTWGYGISIRGASEAI